MCMPTFSEDVSVAFLTGMGSKYLQHLDKCYTEVQVGQVTADQRQAEEGANWYDGSEIDSPGHFDCFPAVKHVRGAGHDLSHDSRKGKMPACKGDCWNEN